MRLSDAAGHVLQPAFDVYGYTYPTSGGTQVFMLSLCGPGEFAMAYEGGWNLISSPLEPIDPALLTVFGPEVDLWQLYGWNGGYVAPLEFHGGIGYWLLLPQPTTIEFKGTPCGSAADPFHTPLAVGWNLIGAPYAVPARLGEADVDSAGLVLEAADAVDRGWLSPALYGWAQGSYSFGDVVIPGHGYWLAALVDGLKLVLRPFEGALKRPGPPDRDDVVAVILSGTDAGRPHRCERKRHGRIRRQLRLPVAAGGAGVVWRVDGDQQRHARDVHALLPGCARLEGQHQLVDGAGSPGPDTRVLRPHLGTDVEGLPLDVRRPRRQSGDLDRPEHGSGLRRRPFRAGGSSALPPASRKSPSTST